MARKNKDVANDIINTIYTLKYSTEDKSYLLQSEGKDF